jgi:DivIVA domain-containing protein
MLTPDEIELKTFAITLRGFDQTEVTRFLHTVASQLQSTLAQLQSARERTKLLQEGEVLKAANRAAAEVLAEAEAKAEELTNLAAKMREEASRIRADALASSEREREKTAQECEEFRLRAAGEIEAILERADADLTSMLEAVRESRDHFPKVGRPLITRLPRKGSQRRLGE